MKRLFKIILAVILILAGLSVIRVRPSRIIYGFYAGECVGNCGTLYEVTTKMLYLDTTSFWQKRNNLDKLQVEPQRMVINDHEGDFNALKLPIPLIMLIDPRTEFGCPDCHDQGGYYLEYTLWGISRRFEIDIESEPFYFTELTKNMSEKMAHIQTEIENSEE